MPFPPIARRLFLGAALALGACWGTATSTVAQAERMLAVPLPAGAHEVRVAFESGVDELLLLGSAAADAQAREWAAAVLGRAAVAGNDPGLLSLGESLAWWPRQLPPRAEGGEVRRDDNRMTKLLLAPKPGQPTRVFVVTFTQ